MQSDLNWIEGLLYRLITAPSGVAEGLARETSLAAGGLSAVVAGDDRLTPEQRVEIYANMYFYRLLDVLKEDFPAVLRALGADHFHNLVTDYLRDCPPTHYSVLYAGSRLADFLRGHRLHNEFPFIADLASAERALIEVFHAADAAPLGADAMRAIAPDEWPALRLRLHPAARMLDLQWMVSDALRAAAQPGAQMASPSPGACTLLVWRSQNQVRYREIDPVECEGLKLLADGAAFAEVCEAIATDASAEDPAGEINRRFGLWLVDGILVLV